VEVRSGYKRTEVGVIPKEWEIQTGENITTLIGKGASPRWQGFEYTNSGMLFVTSENVRDGFLEISNPKYLPLAFHEKLKRTKLQKDDILINLVGASIGRSCLIRCELGAANVNQAVAVFRVKKQYCPSYIAYYFQSPLTIDRILNMQVDVARPNISLGDLRGFLIPLPPLPEQRAIAEVLSDVDALITALDRLIAKKRAIKQGAMQRLLTGQTRLPGFSGPWETRKLGEILDYEQPSEYLVKDTEYTNTGIPVLTAGKTFILGYTDEQEGIYRNLPVIVFDDFTTASRYVDFPFKVKSSAIKLLTVRDSEADLRFVFGRMQILKFALGDHKRYYISEYQHMEIDIPPLPEQRAIAAILSDMDAEIAALKARREKTRALKQGMMQELLTGRTRLV